MSHERNHITPSLIIKRFKTTKDYILNNFSQDILKSKTPAEESILRIEKKHLLLDKKITSDNYVYTNSSSDLFIKNKIYFINQNLLDLLIRAVQEKKYENNEKVLEFINKIEPASLEKSYQKYETRISKILDKGLKNNFINIKLNERYDIVKFFESSYLRATKYRDLKLYLTAKKDVNRKITSFISNFKDKKFDFTNLTIHETIIYFEIFLDFVKKQCAVDIDTSTLELFNLMNFCVYMYNNEINDDAKNLITNANLAKENIFYCKSESANFILGDNPVYTIYKTDEYSVIDEINNILKKEKLINKSLNKLSIMIASPNNAIMITPNEININKNNLIISNDLVKIINAITLFHADEWIVTNKIIKNRNDWINTDVLVRLNICNFFEKKSRKLLMDLNYETAINKDDKYNKINELFLNDFISFIRDANEKLYKNHKDTKSDSYKNNDFKMITVKGENRMSVEYHIIKEDIIKKIDILKELDEEIKLYILMTIKEQITKQMRAERIYSIYFVVGDVNNTENCIMTDIFKLNKTINYDYIMLKLT